MSLLSFSIIDSYRGSANVSINGSSFTFFYPCSNPSFCTGYSVVLNPGLYLLECWGSQGGGINSGRFSSGQHGGYGGYSRGILETFDVKRLFIYIGSSGWTDNSAGHGGFNGGGPSSNSATNSAPGGGSTDFRGEEGYHIEIGSGLWRSEYIGPSSSLDSRILVAGGGGGGRSEYNQNTFRPGCGGGISGCAGGVSQAVTGGTQTGPGMGSFGNGGFGYGASTTSSTSSGGGGGYYGGGTHITGSGGSGYTSPILHDSSTLNGEETFNSPYLSQETGHSGNGSAKITILAPYPTQESIFQSKSLVRMNGELSVFTIYLFTIVSD